MNKDEEEELDLSNPTGASTEAEEKEEEQEEESFNSFLKNKKQKDYSILFDYAIDTLTYSNQINLYHWSCGKGFWHTQMQELYELLREFADNLVETTLAKDVEFAIKDKKYEMEGFKFSDKDALDSLQDFKNESEKIAMRFEDDRGISSLFDDFLADLEKHIGLLKNFN